MNKESNKGIGKAASPSGLLLGFSLICVLGFMPSTAHADPITLELFEELTQTIGPQNQNMPCIIAGTHCQNPDGFPYADFVQGGSISAYSEWSPIYDIDDFPFETLQFDVAIDVNTAKDEEFLEAFEVWLNPIFDDSPEPNIISGELIYSYYGTEDPVFNGNIGALTHNDGNAWANWTLRSIDLTQYEDTDTIAFWASWNGASGGAESFFLYNAPAGSITSPEPTSLLLFGSGLATLGILTIRRRRKN